MLLAEIEEMKEKSKEGKKKGTAEEISGRAMPSVELRIEAKIERRKGWVNYELGIRNWDLVVKP